MSGIVNRNAGRGSGTIGTISTDLSGDSSPQLGGFLDANGNYIQMEKGGDISSASPTVIDTDGDFFAVTGTTSFSAFTVAADRHFFLEFGAVLTMTHGNGTLDLPGAANITTAASDVGEFISTASNVVTCVNYTKRDGTAIVGGLTNRAVNSMTGDGSDTTLSLSQSPGSVNNIDAFIDGVSQIPGTDFTLSGSTLTWTTAPAIGTTAVAVSGALSDVGTPSDGTVTLAKMAVNSIDSDQYVDGSIDNAHIADDAIDSEHYADGSIANAHIADDAIDSEHYAAGSIDEAHIADNAVTLAKMAGGTDGNIISFDASGDPVAIATGDDGQVLTSTGAGSPPAFEDAGGGGPTVTTEQVTTSGTEFVFGSIPSGTSLIIVSFANVGIDDADHYRVQIGDAGGIETSAYVTQTSQINNDDTVTITSATLGFYARGGTANFTGQMILTLVDDDAFTWVQSHSGTLASTKITGGGGYKSLSAELTQVQVDTPGSGSFDSGTVNILYF